MGRRLLGGVIGVVVCVRAIGAAEDSWVLSLDANLTVTLSSYTNNWAGTERGSLSWATQWLGIAEKQIGKNFNTKNTLKLAFGQTKVQDDETEHWSAPQKSMDQIEFESVLRMTLNTWVDPFVGVRITSQFLDGRDPDLAHYGNPIMFAESFGARRDVLKKHAVVWNLRLAGAARQHIDRIWEELSTSDGGLELVSQLDAAMGKDVVKLTSTFRLYEALLRSGADTIPDWWRYPDIEWENKLTVSVTRHIMISYYNQVLYDREIDAHARFRQALALGLSYSAQRPINKAEKKEDE